MTRPKQHVLTFLGAAGSEQYFIILFCIAAALDLEDLFVAQLLLRVPALRAVSGRHVVPRRLLRLLVVVQDRNRRLELHVGDRRHMAVLFSRAVVLLEQVLLHRPLLLLLLVGVSRSLGVRGVQHRLLGVRRIVRVFRRVSLELARFLRGDDGLPLRRRLPRGELGPLQRAATCAVPRRERLEFRGRARGESCCGGPGRRVLDAVRMLNALRQSIQVLV